MQNVCVFVLFFRWAMLTVILSGGGLCYRRVVLLVYNGESSLRGTICIHSTAGKEECRLASRPSGNPATES